MAPNNDSFNSDELNAPDWLNNDFFNKVLQNCEKGAQVKDVKLTPASLKGDHYASVMFRATVIYIDAKIVEKSKSLIIKTMPEYEGNKKEMLADAPIFETEIGMYTEVIPKLEGILRAAGDETQLSPRCLYYSLSPKKCMVFEDIVPHGYEVLRGRSPTADEVRSAYKKIAKWHAVSYKLANENPGYFEKYRYNAMTMQNFLETPMVTKALDNFIDFLGSTPGLEVYKPYFEALGPNFVQDVAKCFNEYRDNRQDDQDYVLCHGDFHLKNMMFKHNPTTKNLEDVLLFDLQVCYMGPMVNDLIYSSFLLMDSDLRLNQKDELLYYYFTNFLETLKKIGYEGTMPKLVNFRKQFMRQRKIEFFILYAFAPMWYAMKSGKVDPDFLMSNNEARRKLYDNPVFVEECRVLLPRYLHLGYLEN